MSDFEYSKKVVGNLRYRVVPDDDPNCPREDDNVCVMAAKYSWRGGWGGDRGGVGDLRQVLYHRFQRDDTQQLIAEDPVEFALAGFDRLERRGIVAAALYYRSHGCQHSISCSFGDDIDASGVAFITREQATREGIGYRWKAWARRVIEAEVEALAAYMEGDIAGYVVEEFVGDDEDDMDDDDMWEHVDSCWGFYPDAGGDHSYCEQEAQAALDAVIADRAEQGFIAGVQRAANALAERWATKMADVSKSMTGYSGITRRPEGRNVTEVL